MNLEFKRKLPIPKDIKKKYPVDEKLAALRQTRLKEVKDILSHKSSKKLLIIGPCSADSFDAVYEYCQNIALVQAKVTNKLLIIPRVFTAKPRSTSSGYLGMLHSPDATNEDLLKGIISIRKLHLKIAQDFNLFAADEILYPQIHRFLSDLLIYGVIGARSSENQEHRFIASGLEIPVGFKNPMTGDPKAHLNSIKAAQVPHSFIYRNWEVTSKGNSFAHAILRGYSDVWGSFHSNINEDFLKNFVEIYNGEKLTNPAFIVDCNHANSSKDADAQPALATDLLQTLSKNPNIAQFFSGFMIESYLQAGCINDGKTHEITYGLSKTDACLGWEQSKNFILELANKL
ncbi:MAG: 3-deoxy-7-phosphoheptulonate synthase [Coriobacteriales bacterium]|nr:3-deoxy-7-phosphoheptulonate synthase [Coriobacteriales bacterium]